MISKMMESFKTSTKTMIHSGIQCQLQWLELLKFHLLHLPDTNKPCSWVLWKTKPVMLHADKSKHKLISATVLALQLLQLQQLEERICISLFTLNRPVVYLKDLWTGVSSIDLRGSKISLKSWDLRDRQQPSFGIKEESTRSQELLHTWTSISSMALSSWVCLDLHSKREQPLLPKEWL